MILRLLTIICVLFCPVFAGQTAATVYVSQTASGPSSDGTSWQTAYKTLTQALAQPTLTGHVWVAQGTYTANHVIPANVAVYGGFAGNEASLTARNPARYRSVLDGNQSGAVVTINAGSRVDGFTIRNGKGYSGGGVKGSSPTLAVIANNIIEDNTALWSGGGIYIEMLAANLQIQGNTIRRNRSLGCGGGVGIYQTSHAEADSPKLYDNVLRDNSAVLDGGGVWAYYSTPHIERCSVWNNIAERNGGGIFIYHSYATIIWNHVSRNIAKSTTNGGGGLYVDFHSIPLVADNTFEYNKAYRGGASWQDYQTQVMFLRNLVVGNKATDAGGALYTYPGAAPEVSNNLFVGNTAAIGDFNPLIRPCGM
ncbi:MAG: right-handed parallel beta-helix repeat-containing protein, partial [Armatimonadota bacterium]